MDTPTLDLQEIMNVNANITTIRLMDPTDYHMENVVRDWIERSNNEKRYYRISPAQAKVRISGSEIENLNPNSETNAEVAIV